MTKKIKEINKLIILIKETCFENVFNPYVQNCKTHDYKESCYIRENNLRVYLNQQLTLDPEIIWVGRDLGYRGGRRTGIPLTDEMHLSVLNQTLGTTKIIKATSTEPVKELTAREIWKLAAHFSLPPFLWNVFPFHPYVQNNAMTNRSHSKAEFLASKKILEAVLDIFEFKYYFALGRDAYSVLDEMGLKPVYVRHPSHGGQREFSKTIREETPRTYAAF
ncbi:MAG: uracil-DNA glycosylase [Methyloglobulus sp.]|nr:uracil-DNA glycosylase [Methyloglobulus sp.]